MEQALLLPEILTKILGHVQASDLLVTAQRVSRHWNTIIMNTPSLQQKLHFMSMSQRHAHLRSMNGLITHTLCKNLSDFLNSAPGTKEWNLGFSEDNCDEDDGVEGLYYFPINFRSINDRPEYSYRKASWRNMIFMQPPVSFTHHFHLNNSTLSEDNWVDCRVTDVNRDMLDMTCEYKENATMGEIYDTWNKWSSRARNGPWTRDYTLASLLVTKDEGGMLKIKLCLDSCKSTRDPDEY